MELLGGLADGLRGVTAGDQRHPGGSGDGRPSAENGSS
jgi:hypothetical protein